MKHQKVQGKESERLPKELWGRQNISIRNETAMKRIYACDKCAEPQKLEEVSPNHFVACYRVQELNKDLV